MERGFETMKKTLAVVLALVMVLCMIPAMGATVTENKTISDKSYDIAINSVGAEVPGASASKANSLTFEYDYEKLKADVTGKFSDDARMAIVTLTGFDADFSDGAKITIDGKALAVDSLASYTVGWDNATKSVKFPVELTKAGYSDTYLVQVTETNDGKTVTETAKVSLKLVNTAGYKTAKTATITNIVADSKVNDKVDAYIVGSKIYLDYYTSAATEAIANITFADENGKAFSAITWAYNPTSDKTSLCLKDNKEQKLDASTAPYYFNGNSDTGIVFKLETASAFYETKKYDLVIRTGITETDPKGIYFADTTKTIAIGEKYAPTVLGVATGRAVSATLVAGKGTDDQVIDVDGSVVIGTREGVAYITASYTTKNGKTYTSSSMKIIVTGNTADETVPPVTNKYVVTATTLNVRKGPGTSYAKAGTLSYGATVEVESITNGWAKLTDGNYVSAQYLRAVSTGSSSTTTMYVTCRTLNVRSGAGTSYSKVGTLSRNAAVEVESVSGGWAKLTNGTYVAYKYLTL